MESSFVRDFPLDNPAVTNDMRLLNSAMAAEDGSVVMLHYHDIWYKTGAGPGNHWLYFRDMNSGAESQFLLPDYVGIGHPVTDNGQAIDLASHVLVGLNELWIYAKTPDLGSVSVWHYALSGSPLPTEASLIERLDFGDQYSHMRSVIQLRSGALLATWYQYPGWGEPSFRIWWSRRIRCATAFSSPTR